jgi:hypothetical protein
MMPPAKKIMNRANQMSFPAVIIEPDFDDVLPRRRFKKICSTLPSKYSPIPCPPSVISDGLQHPANLQYSIPQTVIVARKRRRPNVKYCFETECSSIRRKRASSRSPQITMVPLMKPLPLCMPPEILSSRTRILPLESLLAVTAPSFPGRGF